MSISDVPPRAFEFSRVVSRSAWGADESKRFLSGNEIWPKESRPVRLFIIHHTNTRNDDPDPLATLRAIYEYHCVAKGWGDIGYNYLVDEHGVVYEGRFSGDAPGGRAGLAGREGVVGGHAFGFNYGSVGIALLGSLHRQPPTPEACGALVRLVAALAAWHGIDPAGTVSREPFGQHGERLPVIIGHRHVIPAQDCPGQPFEATLDGFRTEVARLVASASHFDAQRGERGLEISEANKTEDIGDWGGGPWSAVGGRPDP